MFVTICSFYVFCYCKASKTKHISFIFKDILNMLGSLEVGGVLILTVSFCQLLYYCTFVLLYFQLPVFFYRQLSDPKLPLDSRSSSSSSRSRQPEAKSRQQSTFRCPVLHSFFWIFFQIFFFFLKVIATINIPLSCLKLSILFQMIKKVNLG